MRFEYRTSDIDDFSVTVARVMQNTDNTDHCRVTPHAGRYDACLRHDQLGAVGMITLDYGNSVEIAVDPTVDYFVLQVPLAGGFRVRGRGPEVEAGTDTAYLVDPAEPIWMAWDRRCQMLAVPVERRLMIERGLTLRGPGATRGVPATLPLGSGRGRSFRRWMEFMRAEAGEPQSLVATVAARQAEQLFHALLFAAIDEVCPVAAGGPTPRFVERAEEYMDARLEDDIGVADVVAASGVALRTLYLAFGRRHGMAPMAWLRQRRLERARADLVAGDPSVTSVTEVALRWRFWHLGRFAAAYRQRFGESPSETLHRGRR